MKRLCRFSDAHVSICPRIWRRHVVTKNIVEAHSITSGIVNLPGNVITCIPNLLKRLCRFSDAHVSICPGIWRRSVVTKNIVESDSHSITSGIVNLPGNVIRRVCYIAQFVGGFRCALAKVLDFNSRRFVNTVVSKCEILTGVKKRCHTSLEERIARAAKAEILSLGQQPPDRASKQQNRPCGFLCAIYKLRKYRRNTAAKCRLKFTIGRRSVPYAVRRIFEHGHCAVGRHVAKARLRRPHATQRRALAGPGAGMQRPAHLSAQCIFYRIEFAHVGVLDAAKRVADAANAVRKIAQSISAVPHAVDRANHAGKILPGIRQIGKIANLRQFPKTAGKPGELLPGIRIYFFRRLRNGSDRLSDLRFDGSINRRSLQHAQHVNDALNRRLRRPRAGCQFNGKRINCFRHDSQSPFASRSFVPIFFELSLLSVSKSRFKLCTRFASARSSASFFDMG